MRFTINCRVRLAHFKPDSEGDNPWYAVAHVTSLSPKSHAEMELYARLAAAQALESLELEPGKDFDHQSEIDYRAVVEFSRISVYGHDEPGTMVLKMLYRPEAKELEFSLVTPLIQGDIDRDIANCEEDLNAALSAADPKQCREYAEAALKRIFTQLNAWKEHNPEYSKVWASGYHARLVPLMARYLNEA